MQMPSPIGPSSAGITKIHGPHGINAPHAPVPRPGRRWRREDTPRSATSVTISPAAEAAIQATETGGIRQDLVNRIRSEIAAGTYETPAKLDAALDRLLDEIG